jgi:leucyl aminopeptidase
MSSGGYNLKVSGSSIEYMKFDMGGAAAAFGAAKAIASICPLGVEVSSSLFILRKMIEMAFTFLYFAECYRFISELPFGVFS